MILSVCESKDQVKKRLEIMAIYSRQMSAHALDLADLVEKKHLNYCPYGEMPDWMKNRMDQLDDLAGKIDGILATI